MASASQPHSQRASFARRVSSIFERRHAPTSGSDSARATTTFEVPLFLSPTRYQPPVSDEHVRQEHNTRSHSSTQSLIDIARSVSDRVRPSSLSPSSRYSSPRQSRTAYQPPLLPFEELILTSQSGRGGLDRSVEDEPSRSQPSKHSTRRRRRRRQSSIKMKMQSLTRLSATFGATLLVTLITYLVLAVTGTAAGIMFHVVMILFILSLTGVFAHSAIRLFMWSRSLRERRRQRSRGDNSHEDQSQHTRTLFGEIPPDSIEFQKELTPEKPIRIIMAEDEEAELESEVKTATLKQPPPVYGNFRSSRRINPSLVHWRQIPPSPLTPTYDEALSEVHRVMGYRPPSYIESDSGATHIVAQGRRDVDQALRNIHPIERLQTTALRHNMI